jgi:hypothetical protein
MKQFAINVKKGTLNCAMHEVWHLVLSRPITCGQKYKRTIRVRTGIVQEQREDLEATIKCSFGLKGIFQLESDITSKSGCSIKLETSKEVEETIEVEAPKQGRHLLRYYQKKQLFYFEGIESRFFSREPWFLTVERGLDQYRDDSRRYEIDPSCGNLENFTPEPEPDGVLDFITVDGKMTISTPYKVTTSGVKLINFGVNAEINLSELMNSKASIPRESLPTYIQTREKNQEKCIEAVISAHRPLISSGNEFIQVPELDTYFKGNYMGQLNSLTESFLAAAPYASMRVMPMVTPVMRSQLEAGWEDISDLPLANFEPIE